MQTESLKGKTGCVYEVFSLKEIILNGRKVDTAIGKTDY